MCNACAHLPALEMAFLTRIRLVSPRTGALLLVQQGLIGVCYHLLRLQVQPGVLMLTRCRGGLWADQYISRHVLMTS